MCQGTREGLHSQKLRTLGSGDDDRPTRQTSLVRPDGLTVASSSSLLTKTTPISSTPKPATLGPNPLSLCSPPPCCLAVLGVPHNPSAFPIPAYLPPMSWAVARLSSR